MNLNQAAYEKGYNYSLQLSERYNHQFCRFDRRIWIYRWITANSKYDTKISISNIIEVMDYYNQELQFIDTLPVLENKFIPNKKKKKEETRE